VAADYRFLDEWRLPADVERVYDLVGHPLDYPRWWGDVFLAAEGDGGDPSPGKRVAVTARGYLPYRLRFSLTTLEVERPHRIHSRLEGDFEGTGTWLLEEDGDGTLVRLDWRPSVRKAGVRQLSPVLRPLFRSNHTWTMRRGQAAALRELSSVRPSPG
jgi:uncharacterized protein YndB with AHSA1/START domain